MEYLLKASAIIIIFYACYKLFLQRDTFFESNRGFLLLGLVSAFLIPLIVIPIYIERPPLILDNFVFNNVPSEQPIEEPLNYTDILFYVYALGIVVFFTRLFLQLSSIASLLIKNKSSRIGKFRYVKSSKNTSPFSFFNWIVYNPSLFNETELQQILDHEEVHARQYHSIDILLTQLACVVLWFNPFMWLYIKDIKQNLEFIADYNAQKNASCKKSYQYTLLKTSVPTNPLALTNNFYNSLIKKRIVMLHKSKSKKSNLLKYALVLPVLAFFLMSFNTKEVFIDAKTIPEEQTNTDIYSEENKSHKNGWVTNFIQGELFNKKDNQVFLISKNFSDTDFDQLIKTLKQNGVTSKFKGIKRNSNNEIVAIKIDLKSKHSNANYNTSSDEPIKSIKIVIDNNGKSISIGSAQDHDDIIFFSNNGKHKISTSGKHKNVFILKEGSDDTEENIHIVNGDTVTWKTKDKHGKYVKIKRHKDAQIIRGEDAEKHVEVITNTEEDLIIIKNKSKDKKDKITSEKISFFSNEKGAKVPLIIVDGKEVKKEDFEKIDKNRIHSIYVLKDDHATNQYGDKGKNGVMVVKTKDINDPPLTFRLTGDSVNPLYILDGKKVDKSKIETLDPDDIKSIDVLKGEHATKIYGSQNKNGVIIISTKSNENTNDNPLKVSVGRNINNDSTYFNNLKVIGYGNASKNKNAWKISSENDSPTLKDLDEKVNHKDNSPWKVSTGITLPNGTTETIHKNTLFIVDGKESSIEETNKLLPEDIEHIEVLKGNAAKDKYGEKGKNGVIEITTKK
ncbi:M56 family metallopeptidase [Seonamhaeicola marinus]|uniref:TonB-dependent receptor plug domain-containing protein n=1 Tax=Seonamhaeicola marinus TaxID=1912246 RepID=A0A5D0JB55_9FLAO|nr:M56 family metallopeptidase [Seonamhaeicola marinus]TYA92108.1 TonB-dependent receptor plug domain-containing protein [Seonamhaeicola marinus]